MANKPHKICSHIGCNQLVTVGIRYCEQHTQQHKQLTRQQYDKQRGSAAQRGYDYQWQQARQVYLRQHPLCVHCRQEGLLTPATLIHHIKPLSDGGSKYDTSNLVALCSVCHEKVHKRFA